jgi:hypothetical protein
VKLIKTYPSFQHLRAVITGGVLILGQSLQGALSSIADVNRPAIPINRQELANKSRRSSVVLRNRFVSLSINNVLGDSGANEVSL